MLLLSEASSEKKAEIQNRINKEIALYSKVKKLSKKYTSIGQKNEDINI